MALYKSNLALRGSIVNSLLTSFKLSVILQKYFKNQFYSFNKAVCLVFNCSVSEPEQLVFPADYEMIEPPATEEDIGPEVIHIYEVRQFEKLSVCLLICNTRLKK